MFKHIVTTAVLATALSMGSLTAAVAGGGGGGGGDSLPFASIKHPDGSRVTSVGDRQRNRYVFRKKRGGRHQFVRKYRKNFRRWKQPRDANGRPNGPRVRIRTSRPWAYNHTTGRGSVGVRPGVRVTFGGGRGIGVSLSF